MTARRPRKGAPRCHHNTVWHRQCTWCAAEAIDPSLIDEVLARVPWWRVRTLADCERHLDETAVAIMADEMRAGAAE
jgi:hypothetical protein